MMEQADMDASKASARKGMRVRTPLRAPDFGLPQAHNGAVPPAFADRRDAGRRVAELVADLADDDVVVVGLPRGGVPVAAEVARVLGAPLDVLVVGKVGVPGHEELALGAVADDGQVVVNPSVIAAVGLTDDEVAALARRQVAVLARRAEELRGGVATVPLEGRTVVVVDDGMATGATMRVAVEVASRRAGPAVGGGGGGGGGRGGG